MINIKLDKCGGLTEALRMIERARAQKLELMVGCMMGTSLAMAPGYVVGSQCSLVDLDAPLMQTRDREHPMQFRYGRIKAFNQNLWG